MNQDNISWGQIIDIVDSVDFINGMISYYLANGKKKNFSYSGQSFSTTQDFL